LTAVSDELARFTERSSQIERGARVKTIISAVTEGPGRQEGTEGPGRDGGGGGKSSRSTGSSSSSSSSSRGSCTGQLPRIAEKRRDLTGAIKKTA